MHIEVSSLFDLNVYTNQGIYLGKINDVVLEVDEKMNEKKAVGLGITNLNPDMFDTVTRSGVIIPFRWVMAVGDVVLIRHLVNRFKKPDDIPESYNLSEADEQ